MGGVGGWVELVDGWSWWVGGWSWGVGGVGGWVGGVDEVGVVGVALKHCSLYFVSRLPWFLVSVVCN